MDRAKKHVYCHALAHADRLPYADPDLDAYAKQHATPHLHGLPDPDAASHGFPHSHAYSAAHVDGLPDPHAASHAYAYLHAYGEPSALTFVTISRML